MRRTDTERKPNKSCHLVLYISSDLFLVCVGTAETREAVRQLSDSLFLGDRDSVFDPAHTQTHTHSDHSDISSISSQSADYVIA